MTIAIPDESSIIVAGVRRVVAGIEAFENADDFPFYERVIEVW